MFKALNIQGAALHAADSGADSGCAIAPYCPPRGEWQHARAGRCRSGRCWSWLRQCRHRWVRGLRSNKRGGSHQHAALAVTALRHLLGNPGLLQAVGLVGTAQRFNGANFLAHHGGHRHHAGARGQRAASTLRPMHSFDVVIVGAGAAGLFCAGVAGKLGLKVLVLDHSEKVAEKIRISGGGRCNFTNTRHQPRQLFQRQPALLPLGPGALHPARLCGPAAKAQNSLPRKTQGPAVLRPLGARHHRHAAGRMRRRGRHPLAALQRKTM
jgi:hypothetical protein